MIYAHESNLKNKIKKNYNNKSTEIEEFYENYYLPMRNEIRNISFSETDFDSFSKATKIFNNYYKALVDFSLKHKVMSQSKFTSTFLEEISSYLFKDLPDIKSNTLGIYNKHIYAGLKINGNRQIDVIRKDVDFCIGKKVHVSIENQPAIELIIPAIAVEVKTYLDATMFGEVKSSSKAIKSASPNSRTYVLMGYKNLSDEHIIAARQDSVLNEIFVLRKSEHDPIDAKTLHDYWLEINSAINDLTVENKIVTPGKLLNP